MLESSKKEEIKENQESDKNGKGIKRKLVSCKDENISKRAKADTTNNTNVEANYTIAPEDIAENYLQSSDKEEDISGEEYSTDDDEDTSDEEDENDYSEDYSVGKFSLPFYNGKFSSIRHNQLIEKIEKSKIFKNSLSINKEIIRSFLENNPEINGSHLCEDHQANLEFMKETMNCSKTEYENKDIISASIVLTYIIREIAYVMISTGNRTTKHREIESLKECKENKDLLEFDRRIKDSEFPKQSIYIRRCYVDLYNEIINQFDVNENLNILVLGNPGIGKSVFSYYLIFKLKEENKKNIKDIPITYILQTKKKDNEKEYYLIHNKEIKRVKSMPSGVKDRSIVISDSYDVGNDFTNASLIILISSPDVSQYKEFKKKMAVKEYYFDYWNDEEIKHWKNSCTKIDDDVFKRCSIYYGNNPRNINVSSKIKEEEFDEYFNDDILSAIGQYDNIFKYGEYVNSKSTNTYSHKIFKYILIYEYNSNLCVKVEEGMGFISEAIECVFKNKLGLSLKREEFNNIYELYKKENNPSVKGFFYEALVHFILRHYSFLIKLPESNNTFDIFDDYVCPTFQEGEVFNNKNTYYNLNKTFNFPDIDSYGGGWLFQMTISDKHNYSLFIEPLAEILGCNNGLICITNKNKDVDFIKKPISINRFHKRLREEILKKLKVNEKISDEELSKKIIKQYPDEIYKNTITIGEEKFDEVRDFIEKEKIGNDLINNYKNKNIKENNVKYGYEYENLKSNYIPYSSLSKYINTEWEIVKNNDKTLTMKIKMENKNGVDVEIKNIKITQNMCGISPVEDDLELPITLNSNAEREFDIKANYNGNKNYSNPRMTIYFLDENEKVITSLNKEIKLKDVHFSLNIVDEKKKKKINKVILAYSLFSLPTIKECLNKEYNCNINTIVNNNTISFQACIGGSDNMYLTLTKYKIRNMKSECVIRSSSTHMSHYLYYQLKEILNLSRLKHRRHHSVNKLPNNQLLNLDKTV